MPDHRAPRQQPEPPPRPTTPEPSPPAAAALRHTMWILIAINAGAAGILATADRGASPALAVLAAVVPLPVWGMGGFGAVAVALVFQLNVAAHFLAIVLWTVLAASLIFGSVTGVSTAPAASLLFALLSCAGVALHVVGLLYRRALAR